MTIGFTTKQSCVFLFSYGWRHCNHWTQPGINWSTLFMQVHFHWLLFTSTSRIIFDGLYFIFARAMQFSRKQVLIWLQRDTPYFDTLAGSIQDMRRTQSRNSFHERCQCHVCRTWYSSTMVKHAHQRQLINCQSMDVCHFSGNGITFLV